jgi:hypothetical protein
MPETGIPSTPRARAAQALHAARQVFTDSNLTRADRILIRSAILGTADPSMQEQAQPGNRATIHPEVIRWLMNDPLVASLVDAEGLTVREAELDGTLDLRNVRSDKQLTIRDCSFGDIHLDSANLARVNFSHVVGRTVSLSGATIRGTLLLHECRLEAQGGTALYCDQARIRGHLMMGGDNHFTGNVDFDGITVDGDLICRGAFDSSGDFALSADRAHIGGDITLSRDSTFLGAVSLVGAHIGGAVYCRAEISTKKDYAFTLNQARVGGSIFLNEPGKFKGGVLLVGTTVGGQLNCDASFTAADSGVAVVADQMQISGSIFLDEPGEFHGAVRLSGATVGGQIHCSAAFARGDGDVALIVDQAHVNGSVLLRSPGSFTGHLDFTGANIGGEFVCDTNIVGNDQIALIVSQARIVGDVSLVAPAEFTGTVRFRGSTIGGSFAFGAQLKCSDGSALNLNQAHIDGLLGFREGAAVVGEVNLSGATVRGGLICNAPISNEGDSALTALQVDINGGLYLHEPSRFVGAVTFADSIIRGLCSVSAAFSNPGSDALSFSGCTMLGGLSLTSTATFDGGVYLARSTINGTLFCGSSITNSGGGAINLSGAIIRGDLALGRSSSIVGSVTLIGASIAGALLGGQAKIDAGNDNIALDLERCSLGAGRLPVIQSGWVDATDARVTGNLSGWPEATIRFETRGLSYGSVDGGSELGCAEQLRSLTRTGSDLRPGSFDQLAGAYRAAGHADAARRILGAKERALTRMGGYSHARVLWRWLQDWTVGYGYRPFRALLLALIIVTAGAFVAFSLPESYWVIPADAKASSVERPSSMHDHPALAIVYSADAFLPIVDLGEGKARSPATPESTAWWLEKVLAMSGWLLTTIIVTAYTTAAVRRSP